MLWQVTQYRSSTARGDEVEPEALSARACREPACTVAWVTARHPPRTTDTTVTARATMPRLAVTSRVPHSQDALAPGSTHRILPLDLALGQQDWRSGTEDEDVHSLVDGLRP